MATTEVTSKSKKATRRSAQREESGAAQATAPASPAKKNAPAGPKAAEQIANLLRREIITGALHAGDKLLPERILQEQFQVSRPTLREAMRLLESESLIKISRGQHGGARVQKLDISVTARQVGMYLQMEGTTLADVKVTTAASPHIEGSAFDAAIVHDADPELLALASDSRVTLFRECHRSLRVGGRLIVIDSLPRAGLAALLSRSTPVAEPPPVAAITSALEGAGFRAVRLLAEREGFRFIEGLKS